MHTKLALTGTMLGLLLCSTASAQMSSELKACPTGTQYAATEGAGRGPTMAATEGAGRGPKMAATEGAGRGPKMAATEGAGRGPTMAATEGAGRGPTMASSEASSGKAVKLSNGVARLPDGTYCSPVQ